jgi:type II secretion system protein G
MKRKIIIGFVALIGCLVVQYFIFSNFTCADCGVEFPIKKAHIQIEIFSKALWQIREVCGRFPTSQEGLKMIANQGDCNGKPFPQFVDAINKDPWGNPWAFISDGHEFKIGSYGRDGKEGGEFADADIFMSSQGEQKGKESEESEQKSLGPVLPGAPAATK